MVRAEARDISAVENHERPAMQPLIAKIILNLTGLVLISVAVWHFAGVYGLLGYFGFVLRYEKVEGWRER